MWNTIKKVLKKNNGTCIIIEEGKPAFVVVPFDDYEKSLEEAPVTAKYTPSSNEQELLEKINQEITNWKTKQSEESPALELAEEVDEVKIENLPLV